MEFSSNTTTTWSWISIGSNHQGFFLSDFHVWVIIKTLLVPLHHYRSHFTLTLALRVQISVQRPVPLNISFDYCMLIWHLLIWTKQNHSHAFFSNLSGIFYISQLFLLTWQPLPHCISEHDPVTSPPPARSDTVLMQPHSSYSTSLFSICCESRYRPNAETST